MPKSSKKKKDKTADFAKARLKLGKGKQLANNATDTSFKSRSIALPQQTIGLEKDPSKPATRRNLTLDDLLVHLKHYNSSTRKDAIWGLRELFEAHPQLIESSLTPVIQSCARIIGDEDAEVRKALLDFFPWFLRLAPINQVHPHAPLLILFITSAQTNIFPAIRIDAVRFLDVLLEFTPEVIINGWNELESTGSRVLEGYLGLLSAGSSFWTSHKDDAPAPSTSSVTLSPNSKLVVLSSLATFLRIAMSPPVSQTVSTIPTWYIASSFSTHTEYLSFCSILHPRATAAPKNNVFVWSNNAEDEDFAGNFQCDWSPTLDPGFSLGELGNVGRAVDALLSDPSGGAHSDSRSLRIARLAHTLHPILVSTWLDVAPTVFGVDSSGAGVEAQLAVAVGQIAGCLYGMIFRDLDLPSDARMVAITELTTLLGYMSTYLPCVSESVEVQAEQLLRSLSFAYCELTSLAVIESQRETKTPTTKGNASLKSKQHKALSKQIERVGEYVICALDGELKSSSHPLGYSLTAASYNMLLPTIWSLLKYQYAAEEDTILKQICASIVKHAIHTSSRSATKAASTQFVGILVLLNSQPKASLDRPFVYTPAECELFREWYLQLPKVLWEVGPRDLLLTETILRLLLRIEQRRSALLDAATLSSVRARLIPYFATVHPEKGELLGPFTKLKQWPPLRRLFLDVTFVLLQDAAPVEKNDLNVAVQKAVTDTVDADYWSALLASSPH